MFEALVQNAALLITLSFMYATIKFYFGKNKLRFQIISGIWFGIIAIAVMLMPYHHGPGIIYDGRSIVITLAGLWGGGITAFITVLLAGTYRFILGGAGIWAGLTTIVVTGIIGVLFRIFLVKKISEVSTLGLLGIGVVTHIAMLASQLLLPDQALQTIQHIWFPVILIFPLALTIIAKLFQTIERYLSSEQQIRSAEEMYRTTLLSIGDAVICTDINGRVTQMNPEAERLTGWKATNAFTKKLDEVFQIINEHTRKKVESPFTKVLQLGKVVGLANHTILVSKDGREIPIADSGAPIIINNQIVGVVLVFRDQSEERKQQLALESSEERFRKAVLLAPIPIMVFDELGQVLYLSQGWTQLSGYTIKEIPTINDWTRKVFSETQAAKIERHLNGAVFLDQTVFSGDFEIITSSGEKRIWNYYTTPLGESSGKKLAVSIAPDITQRMQIKKELVANEQAYRQLFEDHIAIKLLIDPENWKIVKANKAAAEFYGYSIEELEKMNAANILITPLEKVKEYLHNNKNQKRYFPELKHRLRSGEIRDVEVYSNEIDYKGRLVLHSIIHDITEKKQLMQDLVDAKEKAEESERLKSSFLANVSHEIRTPLNGIVGFSNILTQDENLSTESKQEFAEIINKSSASLLKIINDILDLSRLETGKMVFEDKPIHVDLLLNNLYSIFQNQFTTTNKRNVDLKLQSADIPLQIKGDEVRITQIFSNLLDNALRFTEKGKIEFGVSKYDETQVEFFVADTGIGISKEKQSAVFGRFIQAETGFSRTYGGTGLGLSIVKKLLELMGSQIYIESEPGKGTRFWFRLPLNKESAVNNVNNTLEKESSSEEKPSLISNHKILVVEDNENSRAYFKHVLSKKYPLLYFATTGKEALQQVENNPPDLILLDIGLPDISGLEVARALKETHKNIAIIAQTAYASSSDRRNAIEAGCDDFLVKPIQVSQLMQKLNTVLNP